MWQTYKTVYKIDSAIHCNKIIYNLQHIPVLGRLFSDSLYRAGQLKLVLSIIFSVLGFFMSLLKQAMYFAVFFLAPIVWFRGISPAELIETREMYAAEVLWIFIFLNIILGAKLQHRLSSNYSNVSDTCLLYMRLNPKDYFISRAVFTYIKKTVLLFPAFIVLGFLFGIKLPVLTVFFAGLMSVRIFADGIYACPFDRNIRSKKYRNLAIYAAFVIVCLAAAYVPIVLSGSEIMAELMTALVSSAPYFGSPLAAVAFAAIATVSIFLIRKYSDYEYLRREEIAEGLEAKQLIENANASQAVLKEKDLNINVDSRISHKKGYDYLNALFMARYKKMFAKRAVITALISFALIAGLGIFDFFKGGELMLGLLNRVGLWFFAIYMFAFRDRYTLALFNNIDKYMLPYAWYRRPEAIIKSYFIRLRSSFEMNATMTLPMSVAVLIASLLLGIEARIFLPVIAVILLLTLFYSMHYLTLYYLIQPYSEETKVKSVVYTFFNSVVYIISYTFLQIESVGLWVLVAVAAVVAIYLAISIIMLKHRAPESFRLR